MKEKPFFSIIIPTYNRCALVKKSIDSLKLQTFEHWECIIINDGSTDNTAIEIAQYISNDMRFSLYNQQNSERAIARNNGAEKAVGTYYFFLDSDDYFETNHLANVKKGIEEDLFTSKMYFTNGKYKTNDSIKLIQKEAIPSILPIDFFINYSVVPARVCLHHTIFNTYRFDPRTIIVEDTVLWTEILEHENVKYIPIDSVVYQWHENNSVNIEKFNAYHQRLKGLKVLFYYKKVGKKIPKSCKRKQLNRCFFGISEYYQFQKNKAKALHWMIKSIIFYPEIELKHKLARLLFLLNFVK